MPKECMSYRYYEDYSEIRFFKTDNPAAPPHAHAAIEIVMALRGGFSAFIRDKSYEVAPGDFILVPPYSEHSFSCAEEDIDAYVFIIPVSLYPELNLFFSSVPQAHVVRAARWKNSNIYRLAEEMFTQKAQMSPLTQKYTIGLITSQIIDQMEFSAASQSEASFTERCLQYCQEHYKEPITLKQMAKDMHISYTYASYLFNNILQQNFCTYVNKLRIADALSMIADTDASISDIAFQCGFSCIRTFNQAFTKQVGISPTQLRKKIREK